LNQRIKYFKRLRLVKVDQLLTEAANFLAILSLIRNLNGYQWYVNDIFHFYWKYPNTWPSSVSSLKCWRFCH